MLNFSAARARDLNEQCVGRGDTKRALEQLAIVDVDKARFTVKVDLRAFNDQNSGDTTYYMTAWDVAVVTEPDAKRARVA